METQVSKILDLLTKGMEGVPDIASQAFQIMVRGKFVNGVAEIILAVILLVFSIVVAIAIWAKMKKDDDKYYELIVFLALLILPIVLGLCYLYSGITSVMAPEYDAVMTLLRMVK
nr:MAG TPA: hypothetical protein [Caudoviricetes sp.]